MFTVTPSTHQNYSAYTLCDTTAKTSVVIVPEKGGMAVSFTKNGEEYLWLRQPNYTLPERPRCGMPICFPACGPTPEQGNSFLGAQYPMTVHGFAHSMAWEVLETGTENSASVTVCLRDNEESHKSYPFAFQICITYSLCGSQLNVSQTYQNRGQNPMPFHFGFHPYFAVSAIENLQWNITATQERNGADGSLTPFTGVDFPYDAEQTTRHYAGVQSPMQFTDTQTGHCVTIHFDNHFTNAVLWQQGAEKFVCMEPWNGFPNAFSAEQHETLGSNEMMAAFFSIEI